MIISKDIQPERQVYRLGALLIEVLQETSGKFVELFELFERMNFREAVSVNTFMLTLDWLFLLGAVDSSKGYITKCF